MTGESTHTASKVRKGAMHPRYINYLLKSEVSITLCCQLCSTCYTTLQIKNCSKSTSAIHAYRIKRNKWCRAPQLYYYYYYHHLKSEVSIMFHCRLCSTRYTAVRIKNCSISTSAYKVATIKNTDNFCYEGKPSHATAKSTLFAVSKDE